MEKYYSVFKIIQSSLWGLPLDIEITEDDFDEMKKHAIESLAFGVLSEFKTTDVLRRKWKDHCLRQLILYTNYIHAESKLNITVPYVILKGTSAAQYYPYPSYRMMGDIDIMTRKDDFSKAYEDLLQNGYVEIKTLEREISFIKNGIVVELHRHFAALNNPIQAEYLDNKIINNITPTHVLPDMINGLVLLEHISQHMEHGIGLRQIIDWMMFVDKCLPDSKWHNFKYMAEEIGLLKLAITVTRICEIYMGLSRREWCADADEDLCNELLEYICACGNFGYKQKDESAISERAFIHMRNPVSTIRLLQKRGTINWKLAKKCAFFRPLAWLYQAVRYSFKGLSREKALTKLYMEYRIAKKRKNMFDALGIIQASKGSVVLKDGKYIKEL